MPATTTSETTARALFVMIEPFGPAVEEGELVFTTDPPRDLEPVLSILHTGVRALLSGRRWWGSTAANGNRPRVVILEPASLIPDGIALLSVEGDHRWDRIDPTALIDNPGLFATEKIPQRTRNRPDAPLWSRGILPIAFGPDNRRVSS